MPLRSLASSATASRQNVQPKCRKNTSKTGPASRSASSVWPACVLYSIKSAESIRSRGISLPAVFPATSLKTSNWPALLPPYFLTQFFTETFRAVFFRPHIPDGPEHRPHRSPWPVIPSQHPEDPAAGIGVLPPVQPILVVQMNHRLSGFLRRLRPESCFLPIALLLTSVDFSRWHDKVCSASASP